MSAAATIDAVIGPPRVSEESSAALAPNTIGIEHPPGVPDGRRYGGPVLVATVAASVGLVLGLLAREPAGNLQSGTRGQPTSAPAGAAAEAPQVTASPHGGCLAPANVSPSTPAPSGSSSSTPFAPPAPVTGPPVATWRPTAPGGKAVEPVAAAEPATSELPPFDQAEAARALAGAAPSAAACRAADGPSGAAHVSVVLAPSGRATQATVDGPPFAGTTTGGCIASAFRTVTVSPFSGAPVTVTKTVSIP